MKYIYIYIFREKLYDSFHKQRFAILRYGATFFKSGFLSALMIEVNTNLGIKFVRTDGVFISLFSCEI